MPNITRTARTLALLLLCATVADVSAQPKTRKGYVDAGAGVRLYYRLLGTGRDTIVVLHGGPGFSMEYFAADLEPLAAHHTLLFYDQRGAGRSTLVSDSAGLDAQRFGDDLEAVRKHFKIERLTLLAHSWGAAVAAVYATRYPSRIGRLLLVGPLPATRAQFTPVFARLDARRDSTLRRRLQKYREARAANPGDAAICRGYYLAWFPPHFADARNLSKSRGDFCAGGPDALTNKARSVDRYSMASLGDWDWRPALGKLTAPALIIHGEMDGIPPETGRDWAAALPNGKFLLLERSGHFPYLEVPERFFAAVETFLRPK
ncbi:MAG: alpha/beta fold hydrolase [Gemmatimonadaceae bacterium]